jgi:hypothetical protein
MTVFSSEIVPGDVLAARPDGGFGSPKEDGEVFARVKDEIRQAGRVINRNL